MSSTGVRAPVWTASGMGHWKRLIKIPSATDCYYCITNMTCLIYVSYCVDILVTVLNHLSAIMLHVYVITLPVSCYTLFSGILRMFCIAYILFLQTSLLYMHNTVLPICMFISITSPLDNLIYDITWIRLETWPEDNRLGSDGIKRGPFYIFLLLTCLYIFLLLLICLLYGITPTTSCIIY